MGWEPSFILYFLTRGILGVVLFTTITWKLVGFFFPLCLKDTTRMKSWPLFINLIHQWALELADAKFSSDQESCLLLSPVQQSSKIHVLPKLEYLDTMLAQHIFIYLSFSSEYWVNISNFSFSFLNPILCSV